jgi:hypothetical protein
MTARPPAPDDAARPQYRRIAGFWAVVLGRFRDYLNDSSGQLRRQNLGPGEDEHGDDQ